MESAKASEDPDQHEAGGTAAFRAPSPSSPPPPPFGRASPREDDALFTRPFLGLLGMQAAYGFSFSMFFLLPKYLATLGEGASRIGFVMGGFGVACILTIPFLPRILGTLGRRGALSAATLLLAVAAVAFALVPRPGLMAIPLRAAEGVTWTIMFSTAIALTAEMSPPHRLAQAIGLAGAASLIMNALAPAIGEPLADRFGYRSAFLLSALAALGAAALAHRLPASATEVGGHVAPSRPPHPGHANSGPGRRSLYLVFGLAGLAFSVLFTFLAPFALGHGVRAIRSFFIAYTASALAVRVLGGRMADRLGHASVAAWAVFFYGGVVASTGLLGAHHLAVLGLGFGLCHGAVYPALMALLVGGAKPDQRPRVLGIANGCMSLGISAVFPAGLLVKPLGYGAVFALAGGLTAASAFLLRRRQPQRK